MEQEATQGWSRTRGAGGGGREERTSYAAEDDEEFVRLIQHHPQEEKKIQHSSQICSDRPRTELGKLSCQSANKNVPWVPPVPFVLALPLNQTEHNKHRSLPHCVPATMPGAGYQVTETWPLLGASTESLDGTNIAFEVCALY